MTIECTSCHARYTIADSLVPAQGARVRCKKCGEVFAIKPAATVPAPSELPLVPPTPEPRPPAPPAPPAPSPAPVAPPAPHSSRAETAETSEPPAPSHASVAYEQFVEPTHGGSAPAHSPSAHAAPPHAAPAAPAPESAPAPAAPTQAPAGGSALPAGTPIPDGLEPEERKRHERARRLARVLASDIAIYNREKRDRGILEGNLVAVLGYEIKKSWDIYKERVGADFANGTPYFRDALNEIVAEGRKVF
ncbi:MAG TPA: zinc-ribbon domain-containing protein [Candidatus Eisenbacteria bacterium]